MQSPTSPAKYLCIRTRKPSAPRTARMGRLTMLVGLFVALGFAHTASANSGSPYPTPLSLSNNYLVTGDYVVGGVGLRGLGVGGFAKGTITIPDPKAYATSVAPQQVPAGADIVAAYLYW